MGTGAGADLMAGMEAPGPMHAWPPTADDAPSADMVDLAFAVQGRTLERDHRRALADALVGRLDWLADEPRAGVHRLKLSAGGDDAALLSRRTRLTLRIPRARAAQATALSGCTLVVQGHALTLGEAQLRELLPWGTLYAHLVAADDGDDEAAFLERLRDELRSHGITCRVICGRRQALDHGALSGFGVMLDHLDRGDARRILDSGLGPHRLWGCGVFVPHKSAAAVGAPD